MLDRLKTFSQRFNLAWPLILFFMVLSSFKEQLDAAFYPTLYFGTLGVIACFFIYGLLAFTHDEKSD